MSDTIASGRKGMMKKRPVGTRYRPCRRTVCLAASLVLTLLLAIAAQAHDLHLRPEWARRFTDSAVAGTFVLYDSGRDIWYASDAERPDSRFVPASTFKIANALIAADLGIVTDERQVFPWITWCATCRVGIAI